MGCPPFAPEFRGRAVGPCPCHVIVRSLGRGEKGLSEPLAPSPKSSPHPDLFIRQIAGRVRGPEVAGQGLGPDPEVAAADVQPAAGGAAALDVGPLVLQFAP